jgi:hypothetical protein
MAIFQLYPEHGIGQGFQNHAILFYQLLLGHTYFGGANVQIYSDKKTGLPKTGVPGMVF